AVDLVPASFKGTPPDLPAPPPPSKTAVPDITTLPGVKVLVGEYANFTRLTFDWPSAVAYSAFPGRGKITIRFETIARPDFSALESRTPAWVRNAGWHIDGMTMVVEFETDPESTFHDFREGTRIA